MRIITKENLKTILENHLHWLREDCDGWKKMRANLYNANLRYANLSNADLCYADLRYTDLRYANLSNANLSNADLRYANLSNANLYNANLSNANLRYANLSNADLSNADLYNANLRYANLSNADLRYANLYNADLSNANLSNANLSNADLSNANLYNADLSNANLHYAEAFYYPLHCPSSGSFTGYKKALYKREDGNEGHCLIALFIPADARRSSATSFKCRCDKAYVINMWSIDKNTYGKNVTVAYSNYDRSFKYERGLLITVEDFCEDRWQECASGIHFFVDENEAERYSM